MAAKSKPMPLVILGRRVGTFTGWDQNDTLSFMYYGFKPATGVSFPAGDVSVDYENGIVEAYNKNGSKVVETADLITLFAKAKMTAVKKKKS